MSMVGLQGLHLPPLLASRTPVSTHRGGKHPTAPCARCGVWRTLPATRKPKFELCTDCYGILTKTEREAWRATL